jgi:hypothetical protein
MPGQQQAALLHQPVDPLGVDRIEAGGSPLALEERGDPPVSIGRPGVHQVPDIGREFSISGAGLGTTLPALASCLLNQTFKLANPLLQPADLGCGDHMLIHPHRLLNAGVRSKQGAVQ